MIKLTRSTVKRFYHCRATDNSNVQNVRLRIQSYDKLVSRRELFHVKNSLARVVTKLDVRHWLEGNAMDAGSQGITNKRTKDALKGEEEDSRRELRLVPFP